MKAEKKGPDFLEAFSNPNKQFIKNQAKAFRGSLDSLHLSGIAVSSVPEWRDNLFFQARPTVAISGITEDSIALFIALSRSAAHTPHQQSFHTLLIAPTPETSGILVDEENKVLQTDSFWMYEDGVLKYLVTPRPVTIDVLNSNYDSQRTESEMAPFLTTKDKLKSIADDKIAAKAVLKQANIYTPRGIIITHNEDYPSYSAKVADLVELTADGAGYVIKEPFGSSGNNVCMVSRGNEDRLDEIVWDLHEDSSILVEERIKPFELTPEQKKLLGVAEDEEIDYNFRILVDIDSAKAFDGEIRYKAYDNLPVNVTSEMEPARAVRLSVLGDSELVQRIFATAEQATKAICQAALEKGEEITGIAGIDIMREQNDLLPVLEVNIGSVGGIATLTGLDRRPLESVLTKLAPLWSKKAQQQYYQRPTEVSPALKRVGHNEGDYQTLFDTYLAGGEYTNAEKMLLALGHGFRDQDFVILNLYYLAQQTGNTTLIKQYITEAIALEEGEIRPSLRRYKRWADELEQERATVLLD